tara:strand:+ start:5296 stop:5550 length:255 start_codon:yes stop_codon:yes gene_type:complete
MRDKIIELYGGHTDEGLLFADGLDDAIIGVCPSSLRVVYSRTKTIEIFIKDGLDEIEAEEFAEYNTFNAYVGEQTPIWVDDLNY